MRLVAQRVASGTGENGVNAFCYLHGAVAWLDDPPPELGTGRLAAQHIEVKPGGNRVKSYIELLAPDYTPNSKILRDAWDAVDLLENEPLPLRVQNGDTRIEFNAELGLAPPWRAELFYLLQCALNARV